MDSAAAASAAERTLKSAMHLLRRGGNALRELTDASAIQFIPTDVTTFDDRTDFLLHTKSSDS